MLKTRNRGAGIGRGGTNLQALMDARAGGHHKKRRDRAMVVPATTDAYALRERQRPG